MTLLKSLHAHHMLIGRYHNPLQDNLERIGGQPLPAFDLNRIHPALLGIDDQIKDRNTFVRERLTGMGVAVWRHEDPVSLRLDTRLALLGDPHVQDYRAFNVQNRFDANEAHVTHLRLRLLAKRFETRPTPPPTDSSINANSLTYFRVPAYFQYAVEPGFQGLPSPIKDLLIAVQPDTNSSQKRVFIGDAKSKSLYEWNIAPNAKSDTLEANESWKNRFDQKSAWWNLVHSLLPELSLKLFLDENESPKIGWLAAAAPAFGAEDLTAYNRDHNGVLNNTLLHILVAQALGPGSWRQGWNFTPIEKVDVPSNIEHWNIRDARIADEHKLSPEEKTKFAQSGFFDVPTAPGLMSSIFSPLYHHYVKKLNRTDDEATVGVPSSILFGMLAHLKHQQTHHDTTTYRAWNKLGNPNSKTVSGLILDGPLDPITMMVSECILRDCFSSSDLMSRYGIYWPSNPYDINNVLGMNKPLNAENTNEGDLIKALQVRLMGGFQ